MQRHIFNPARSPYCQSPWMHQPQFSRYQYHLQRAASGLWFWHRWWKRPRRRHWYSCTETTFDPFVMKTELAFCQIRIPLDCVHKTFSRCGIDSVDCFYLHNCHDHYLLNKRLSCGRTTGLPYSSFSQRGRV